MHILTISRFSIFSILSLSSQLAQGGKNSRITGFNDPNIGDGKVVIDLVDCLKPGSVNYDLIKEANTEEVYLTKAFFYPN